MLEEISHFPHPFPLRNRVYDLNQDIIGRKSPSPHLSIFNIRKLSPGGLDFFYLYIHACIYGSPQARGQLGVAATAHTTATSANYAAVCMSDPKPNEDMKQTHILKETMSAEPQPELRGLD